MANLKEVRNRITSVKSTQQITSAMKMVSASKLRKAQYAIQKMRPYDHKLQQILLHIAEDMNQKKTQSVFSEQREVTNVLLIVMSSNRGLCGAFNSNVMKTAEARIEEAFSEQKANGTLDIFALGKKAFQYFRRTEYNMAGCNEDLIEKPAFEPLRELAESFMEQFAHKQYDRIEVVYNRFKNAANQILTVEQFLPVVDVKNDEDQKNKAEIEYLYEPDQETILRELLPKTLKVQLYKMLLDSYTAEQGARMTAMHQATDNAIELLRDLQLAYNKARQASITNELIEITSGADALRS